MARAVTDDEYAQLLRFRTELRRFLRWSEEAARAEGLTAAQHQLLLAVRGTPAPGPTIGDVAEHLLLRHHSAVELVDRCEAAGLVERAADPDDRRAVRLRLSASGRQAIRRLSAAHLAELDGLGRVVPRLPATDGSTRTPRGSRR